MTEPRKSPTLKLTEDDVFVATHFERDNRNVDLHLKVDEDCDSVDHTIRSWVDDQVDEAVEDGFLSAKDWKGTAFSYMKDLGVVAEVEARANERLASIWDVVMDAAASFESGSMLTEPSEVTSKLPVETRKILESLPESWQRTVGDELSQLLPPGWEIVGPDGRGIHGEAEDPFGLEPSEVLAGEAIATAREWTSANPGYSVVAVRRSVADEELVDAISLREPAPGI